MMAAIDVDRFLQSIIRGGGRNNIITGLKGDGKTRTAVTIMQICVEGRVQLGNVECITNIKFFTRANGRIVMKHPPGVYFETAFSEIFRRIGQILGKYPNGDVTILLVLDEAQNYMINDKNFSKENQAMIKFMANTRKFRLCSFLLTPTEINLVPKIRNFECDLSPGYCSVLWKKAQGISEKVARKYGVDHPEYIVWLQPMSSENPSKPCMIPYTSWANVRKEDVKAGQYAYDTLAIADLSMGANPRGRKFEIEDILQYLAEDENDDMSGRIDEYFAVWDALPKVDDPDGEDTEYLNFALNEQVRRIIRAREKNIPWDAIEYIWDEPRTTLQSRVKKVTNSRVTPSFFSDRASIKNDDEKHAPGASVYIYLTPRKTRRTRGPRSF